MTDQTIIVTKLERDPEGGFWKARVSVDGQTLDVDRRFGSWQGIRRAAPRSRTLVRCDLLPGIPAALQERVRPLETRERREAEAAAKAAEEVAT